MPIFDQGYQHWDGAMAGHAWRWLAITRQGVRSQLRKRFTRVWLLLSLAPALVLASALVVWGLLEQGSSLLEPIAPLLRGLPEELRAGPAAFRVPFWTMAFDRFLSVQTFFAMILVGIVGPDLISQDLRFNAMPLYLSRPMRRIDYFLGKLGVIALFLAMVTVVPAVLAYVVGLAFSFQLSVLRDTGRVLLGAIGFGLLFMLSAGMLMLAISSGSRSSRMVGALWLGLWLVSSISAGVLIETVERDWCPLVSYTSNLARSREELLGTQDARNEFLYLAMRARETARDVARSAMPFGPLLKRRPVPQERVPITREMIPRQLLLQSDQFRWQWSAAVLAGLFVASAAVLSTRVRSLDRLK